MELFGSSDCRDGGLTFCAPYGTEDSRAATRAACLRALRAKRFSSAWRWPSERQEHTRRHKGIASPSGRQLSSGAGGVRDISRRQEAAAQGGGRHRTADGVPRGRHRPAHCSRDGGLTFCAPYGTEDSRAATRAACLRALRAKRFSSAWRWPSKCQAHTRRHKGIASPSGRQLSSGAGGVRDTSGRQEAAAQGGGRHRTADGVPTGRHGPAHCSALATFGDLSFCFLAYWHDKCRYLNDSLHRSLHGAPLRAAPRVGTRGRCAGRDFFPLTEL